MQRYDGLRVKVQRPLQRSVGSESALRQIRSVVIEKRKSSIKMCMPRKELDWCLNERTTNTLITMIYIAQYLRRDGIGEAGSLNRSRGSWGRSW